MFRYKLRTLLILLAILPPLLAVSWWGYGKWREEQARRAADQPIDQAEPTTIPLPPLYPPTPAVQ